MLAPETETPEPAEAVQPEESSEPEEADATDEAEAEPDAEQQEEAEQPKEGHLQVIELDGDSHADQAAYDDERTAWLEGAGCTVLRFSNRQALNEVGGVLKVIAEVCGVDLSVGGKGEEPSLHLSPAAGERAWDAAVC